MKLKKSILVLVAGLASLVTAAPDIQGKISQIMVRPGSTGSKTAVRIYFSSISGTDRFSCFTNPGYVEINDDNSMVGTGRLNQMLSLALTAFSSGSQFGVDFQMANNYPLTCGQGTFAYILP